MAYDPKSYLDQALKTGFESIYSQPSSIDESPQYQGDVATFGDVQVRPLMELFGQTEQDIGTPQQTGYAVSRPLKDGFFENTIYDNDGKFLRKTISEPADKWWEGPLQLAMFAAPFVGGPLATAANVYKGVQAAKSGDILGAAASILPGVGQIPGVSPELAGTLKTAGGYAKTASALEKAIENKDIFALLEATSGIPGAPKVPTELTDILKGAGQANRLREAISSGNPEALFREIVGLSKSGVPFSKLADVTGEDAIAGFFAPGGEGYDATQDDIDSILARYKDTSSIPAFTPGSDDVYEDIESLLARYENQGFANQPTGDLNESINVTGTLPKNDVIIPDWDFMEVPDRTPGSPTDTTPGTVLLDDDRTVATTPGTTGTKTTTPTKPATEQKGTDWAKLFALLGSMQRPEDKKEQYQTATGIPEYEDLMYGLRSGETPYMRG